MTTVCSTINVPFKESLDEKELARLLKTGILPDKYHPHIQVFFSELPISEIMRFARKYGISGKKLKAYYYMHIRELNVNQELEEALKYD